MTTFETRRGVLLIALLLMAASSNLAAQYLFRNPVVGGITDNGAIMTVWTDVVMTFSIEYGTDPALAGTPRIATDSTTVANERTVQVALSGLLPNTRYYYRIRNDAGIAISQIFSFKTFPSSGVDAPFTLLFGSCQQSHPADSGKTFDAAANLGGDLFIQLGDWGYHQDLIPGYPTAPGTITASYAIRFDTSYSFAKHILSQMGVAYVWDDNDWVGNNSDGAIDPALKARLLQAYRRYIPSYPLPNPSAGIWQSFTIGNAEVFMIDDRAERSPVDSAFKDGAFNPPPGHSMLAGVPVTGTDQMTWLLNAIRSSRARWKILVSQVFFNPATGPFINLALIAGRPDLAHEFADKWIGYPADIDSMRHLFQQGYGRNFLIICGDAHTNLYDNGSHSLVPEFMVGNLDKENSNLYATLKNYGFDVWTAGQTESASTVGRIRVETTPRQKLIVESFDESGTRVLSYEMVDSASASVSDASGSSAWRLIGARVDAGGVLRVAMENAPVAEGSLVLYNLDGEPVLESSVALDGGGSVAIPAVLASGVYVGRMRVGEMVRGFRVVVVR
jgi:phosphodiesterase/alkaline phosphatase D-like protein